MTEGPILIDPFFKKDFYDDGFLSKGCYVVPFFSICRIRICSYSGAGTSLPHNLESSTGVFKSVTFLHSLELVSFQ